MRISRQADVRNANSGPSKVDRHWRHQQQAGLTRRNGGMKVALEMGQPAER
jgi:hypothetical protein